MLGLDLEYIPILIANGTSLSAQINLGAKTLVGIIMPAAWTAAALTFQSSGDGGQTFQELQDGAGAAVTVTANQATNIQLDPTKWRGANCLKVRSGTTGTPVNQGADRTLQLVVRSVS